MVLKSGSVLEADAVVAGIGNIINLETVLFLITNQQPRIFVNEHFLGFFFLLCSAKLNAFFSCISVCASEFSFARLFVYVHSDLSTHPYFWLKQSNNHILNSLFA